MAMADHDHGHDHDHDHEYMVPDMVPDMLPDMLPAQSCQRHPLQLFADRAIMKVYAELGTSR